MKRLALLLLALLPMALPAQKCSLSLTVDGLSADKRLLLLEPVGGRLLPADTLHPDKKGVYRTERQTANPWFFALTPLGEQGAMVHVMLLPGEKVSLTMDYRPATRMIHIASTKGSGNMSLYSRYNQLACDAAVTPSLQAGLPDAMEQLLREHPSELMSAFMVTYFESAFEQYAGLYKLIRDSLIGRYPDHDFVRHLDQKLVNVVLTGMEAPDIVMAGRDGKELKLSDLRGKVVLIDFWASWCRPCRAENPNVVRIYNRYHDKGFEVFSVSLDNKREAWLQAIVSDGLVWENHVSDLRGWSSAAGRLYGISSIPATVLVDRDGKVLARNLRGEQLEQALQEIFDKP